MNRPPHLPFMEGSPQFVPGLRRIEQSNWLVPDTECEAALPQKHELFQTRLSEVFGQTDASRPAQVEATQMVCAALGVPLPANREAPLLAVSRLISDDLCLMEKQDSGWILTAASLCSPTHFSLARVLGGSMAGLHKPVPDGAPALSGKIEMMFDRIAPGLVIERFNWTVQAGAMRFMPDAAPMRALAAQTPLKDCGRVLHLRVERQTIVRLPKTRAVLFCIRVCIDPLHALSEIQQQTLYQNWTQASAEVRAYKGWAHIDPLMRAFFKK